jgi:peptide/nickel transport system permease protein
VTKALRWSVGAIRRYPTVAVSLFIILSLIGISIYAMVNIPLSEALAMWNAHEHERGANPRAALPVWTNLFRRENLPATIIVRMDQFESTKETLSETMWRETTLLTFDYNYTSFPSEMAVSYNIRYGTKRPLLTLTWIKPDGSETELFRGIGRGGHSRLKLSPSEALGASQEAASDTKSLDGSQETRAEKGTYTLRAEVMTFEEEGFSMDGQILVLGGVYGIAGTDGQRRDLAPPLLWGTPFALMFGLLAATATTALGFATAATGSWLGGWVDATIQRITEVNMMIPFLPVILMVGFLFSQSIWVLLGFIVGLNIFSGQLKAYRAMFLQLVHADYIEAARAYGASNARIIFRYLIPHAFPVVLPRLILGVPLFVFLEASLAFLGISDPNLLTWGNLLSEARGAMYLGDYHMILEPAFMLLLTGLSFSMLGYTLDRVFNPRLRGI